VDKFGVTTVNRVVVVCNVISKFSATALCRPRADVPLGGLIH
jgi:hypothetical protein